MLRRCHTAELTSTELAAVRALLEVAFGGFDDHDWTHALGGMHAPGPRRADRLRLARRRRLVSA